MAAASSSLIRISGLMGAPAKLDLRPSKQLLKCRILHGGWPASKLGFSRRGACATKESKVAAAKSDRESKAESALKPATRSTHNQNVKDGTAPTRQRVPKMEPQEEPWLITIMNFLDRWWLAVGSIQVALIAILCLAMIHRAVH